MAGVTQAACSGGESLVIDIFGTKTLLRRPRFRKAADVHSLEGRDSSEIELTNSHSLAVHNCAGMPNEKRTVTYSRMPCFNSQTRKAARSRLFVRVSVPTAGRAADSSLFFAVGVFELRLAFFGVFVFDNRRTDGSFTFKSPPLVIGPIISLIELAAFLPRRF